ncbi:MAG: hypothetical protein SBU_001144 [Candidatus Syntrophoarchaeum butanivorans]|uniref:Uncharacterized protein n=1 Tax=Candidatus Syntropharchaeum butanivorans TaxID=1839936 RepID=A0A1F2P4P4_9EURY|nr:MAG: hypothetical protein SBU_001144 [Candidatus Syntrophoarchaeum butanivorans]
MAANTAEERTIWAEMMAIARDITRHLRVILTPHSSALIKALSPDL